MQGVVKQIIYIGEFKGIEKVQLIFGNSKNGEMRIVYCQMNRGLKGVFFENSSQDVGRFMLNIDARKSNYKKSFYPFLNFINIHQGLFEKAGVLNDVFTGAKAQFENIFCIAFSVNDLWNEC